MIAWLAMDAALRSEPPHGALAASDGSKGSRGSRGSRRHHALPMAPGKPGTAAGITPGIARSAAVIAACGLLAGCGGLSPVVGHPWVEDRGLALTHEDLLVTVERDAVLVDARLWMRGHGDQPDRELTFPCGAGDSPTAFRVTFRPRGRQAHRLQAEVGQPGGLPTGGGLHVYDIWLPGSMIDGAGGLLRVEYNQRVAQRFHYVLRTGAYWRGTIQRLRVVITDPYHRVGRARVEGMAPQSRRDGTWRWTMNEVEPDDGLEIELR